MFDTNRVSDKPGADFICCKLCKNFVPYRIIVSVDFLETIFSYLFTLTSVFKDKMSLRSQKTEEIMVSLIFFKVDERILN